MSFSISIKVEDGQASVTGQSLGEAAAPDGAYQINGHVHHTESGDAAPSLSLLTPIGTVSANLTDQASR